MAVLRQMLAAVCTLWVSGVATAQTSTATAADAPRAAQPAEASDAGAGWRLYSAILEELDDGRLRSADILFRALVRTYPGHPGIELAAEALGRSADATLPAVPRARPEFPTERRPEAPSHARPPPRRAPPPADPTTSAATYELIELSVGQGLHGLALGIELCLAVDCESAAVEVAAPILGAGLGVGAALLIGLQGLEPGHANLLNASTLWGAWQGLAAIGIARPEGFAGGSFGILMGSQLLGLALGELSWHFAKPTPGQVSFAGSVGIWSGFFTGAVFGMIGERFDSSTGWGAALATSDAGLLVGGIVSRYLDLSRGRMLVIDLSGLLGALTGLGLATAISAGDLSHEAGYGATIGGAIAGLALATGLTWDWDVETTVRFNLAPAEGGFVVGIGGTL